MMNTILRGFLFIFIVSTTTSCYDCGPRAEPSVTMYLYQDSSHIVERISALGARSDSVFNTLDLRSYFSSIELPVSMLQDSTTFLFYAENQTDTLTLFYKRIFDTKRECGYYIDLTTPETGPLFKTTLNRVQVEYNSYLGKMEILKGPRPLGIVVTIGK